MASSTSSQPVNPAYLDGVGDMSLLIHLGSSNVLHNIKCRYNDQLIYTSISKVLIAINPYKWLPIYGTNTITQYREFAKASASKKIVKKPLPPHVFSVAQDAYTNLCSSGFNQAMVVCGESGSGKTESAKQLLRYLAFIPGEGKEEALASDSIESQVIAVNPILESFGNAKTVLNDNSSRFGKFTKVVYGDGYKTIAGCFIETYLLEKSRVVRQDKGERNYHAFYMLCCASEAVREPLHITTANDFHYTNQSGCMTAAGWDDAKRFDEMVEAMKSLNIDDNFINRMFSVVAGVLHLGNIQFTEDRDACEILPESEKSLEAAAKCLQVPKDQLRVRLITQQLVVLSQTTTKQMGHDEAVFNRDTLAKAIYNGLFSWVREQINTKLYKEEARKHNLQWIGILDVFGFESFVNNSFEQFCINFANERLQQYFNSELLESEQEEYLTEGIYWEPILIQSNQNVINLIDHKPQGLLALLSSEAKAPAASPSKFLDTLFKFHGHNPRLTRVERIRVEVMRRGKRTSEFKQVNHFILRHYAGPVEYDCELFLTKNNDATRPEITALINSSECPIVSELTNIAARVGVEGSALSPRRNNARLRRASSAAKKRANTVGGVFSNQLQTLVENLQQTTPYFIRCIKPNTYKEPFVFVEDYITPQLKCGGIMEALRILKLGYPTRCNYQDIWDRYGSLLQPPVPDLNMRDFTESLLLFCEEEDFSRSEWQLGLSKVFFRPGKQHVLEKLLSAGTLPTHVMERMRRFLVLKKFLRVRCAVRVFVRFNRMLKALRLKAKLASMLFLGTVVSRTFVRSLRRIRRRKQEQAAVIIQAQARTMIAQSNLKTTKTNSKVICKFLLENRFRKVVGATLIDRIVVRHEKMKKLKIAQEKQRAADEKRIKEQRANYIRLATEKQEAIQTHDGRFGYKGVEATTEVLSFGAKFSVEEEKEGGRKEVLLFLDEKEKSLAWVCLGDESIKTLRLENITQSFVHYTNDECSVSVHTNTDPVPIFFVGHKDTCVVWCVSLNHSTHTLSQSGHLSRQPTDPNFANALVLRLMVESENDKRERQLKRAELERESKKEIAKALNNDALVSTLQEQLSKSRLEVSRLRQELTQLANLTGKHAEELQNTRGSDALVKKMKTLSRRASSSSFPTSSQDGTTATATTTATTTTTANDDYNKENTTTNNNNNKEDSNPLRVNTSDDARTMSPSNKSMSARSRSVSKSRRSPQSRRRERRKAERNRPSSPKPADAVMRPLSIYFPDNSYVLIETYKEQQSRDVVDMLFKKIGLMDAEGFAIFDVDWATREERCVKEEDSLLGFPACGDDEPYKKGFPSVNTSRASSLKEIEEWYIRSAGHPHRFVFKRRLHVGFPRNDVSLRIVYFQTLEAICDNRYGLTVEDLENTLAKHRFLMSLPYKPIGSGPVDQEKLLKMSPFTREIESLELLNSVHTSTPMKKDTRKQIAAIKKKATAFKKGVKKLQKNVSKTSMSEVMQSLIQLPVFGCEFFPVVQHEKKHIPEELIIGVNMNGLFLLNAQSQILQQFKLENVVGCGSNTSMFSLVVQSDPINLPDETTRFNFYTRQGLEVKSAIRTNIKMESRKMRHSQMGRA